MRARQYIGIFVLSAATLLLELSLIRVLAVANWYHFGFLIISTALLGFGVSGIALTLSLKPQDRTPLDRTLTLLAIAFGLVSIASYWLMQRIPFDPFSLLTDHRQLLSIPAYYLIASAPFFCSGLAIGLLLSQAKQAVNRLYAADLMGAGAGCVLVVAAMSFLGGEGSVIAAAGLGFVAAALFCPATARPLRLASLFLALASVPLAIAADRIMPISVIASKRHPLQPADAKPLYSAWNAFSRVDLLPIPADAAAGRPDPGYSIIIDGGAAGTAIPDLRGGARHYFARSPAYKPTGVAYLGKPSPNVLIIGSGAGREVLEGLYYHARSITAVEINPIVTDIVGNRFSAAWGNLFAEPGVKLVTEDGRSFIRRSKEKYDIIISIQTMTDAAVTSGAMAMSESYLFTKEAFGDYLDHLSPDGVLLITRPPHQIAKLFATARELFEKRGLGSPAGHLAVFEGALAPYGHTLFNTIMLFKKSAWTTEELGAVVERLGVGHPERWFGKSPKIFYAPPVAVRAPEASPFTDLLNEIISARDLRKVYAAHRQLLAPATDDEPFFNQNIKWSSLRPYDFDGVFRAQRNGSVLIQPVAEVLLVVMLIEAIVVAAIFILLPVAGLAHRGLRIARPFSMLTYFAGLGLGFIMIEIVFVQRFLLFLGQPIYTFAVVLACLLAFTGIGSWLVDLTGRNRRRGLAKVVAAILAVLLVLTIASPAIFAYAIALPLAWRVIIVIAMIAPLGILLGMPFPLGMRIVSEEAPAFVPWAWGVNGFFTVVGSIAASILGMALGFTAVLTISGACYLVAAASLTITRTPLRIPRPDAPGLRPLGDTPSPSF